GVVLEVVDRNLLHPRFGKLQRDAAANSARAARDEGGPLRQRNRHGVSPRRTGVRFPRPAMNPFLASRSDVKRGHAWSECMSATPLRDPLRNESAGAATTGPLIRSFGERGAGAELEAWPRRLSCRYVPKFRT